VAKRGRGAVVVDHDLLKELNIGFESYSEDRNPDLYWNEVFSRLLVKSVGHNLEAVPDEARHIAG
jgi:hypothetical protein